MWILTELSSYGPPAWISFVVVTVLSAAIGKTRGMFVGHVIIAAIVLPLDFNWMRAQMASPTYDPNTGPDFDGVFLIVFPIGVLLRVVAINTALLPVALATIWARRRIIR